MAPRTANPVLLVHGNCSSADFWQPLWRLLPDGHRIIAPDLRGYGGTETAPVDATRGLRDFADDVLAVLDVVAPGGRPVVVGHSMGGGVAMQLMIERPEQVAGLVLESPVSPYGFGGTRDATGTATTLNTKRPNRVTQGLHQSLDSELARVVVAGHG